MKDEKMRRTVIAGNWKMNMTPSETKAFITELAPMVKGLDKCDVVLCVPYVDIATAVEAAKGTNIHIGAENVHFAESGAYTGEISAKMLTEIGTEYVVIGHSERRQYFGETDATVNLRTKAALAAGLKVILCLGEPQDYSGEGNCRVDLDLPGVQNELAQAVIGANPNTAVVLFTGRPLAIKKLDSISPAILNMWFPGTEGGSAAADLLFSPGTCRIFCKRSRKRLSRNRYGRRDPFQTQAY